MNKVANRETWRLIKQAAEGEGGVVVSQHYTASEVGAAVLADGGNAIDAAVATGFAVSACEPWMSGVGGCGCMLFHDAATQSDHCVDFSVRAARALDPADYPLTGATAGDLFAWPEVVNDHNVHGPGSIAVPGYVRGMQTALQQFGTRPWRELLQPAVELAAAGIAVDWYATLKIASAAAVINRYATAKSVFLDSDGLPPVGEWGGPLPQLQLGNLSDTLGQLASAGADDFYSGDIAAGILRDLAAIGSSISAEDLAQYRAKTDPPIRHTYRDATITAVPGLCAGPTLVDAFDRLQQQCSENIAADPTPYAAYADALFGAYEQRLATMGHNDSLHAPSSTTHICVVDRQGNVVSLTQTLLSLFGSKVMLPGSGILMNNGVMWFDPRPGRPNSLTPGAQPLANMCPALLHQQDSVSAIGASGGRRIMAAVFQLIAFMVDAKLSPEQAAHTPRIDVSGSALLTLDDRLAADTVSSIASRYDVVSAANGVYPALFACPSIAQYADGRAVGAAYVASPWAYACAADTARRER